MPSVHDTPNSLNQSVWSACEILNYLTGKGWCRLKDIAEELDMDVARAHRLLRTLVLQDFAQYDPDTHKYSLGLKFFTISYSMSRDVLVSAARPQLEYAASELFETINLGMLDSNKAKLVHVYRVYGDLSTNYKDVALGVSRYVNESALGKCILAYLPYAEQQDVLNRLEYRRHTDKTLITKAALQQDLIDTKKRGYACDDEEIEPGVFCFAVPIMDSNKNCIAAASVSTKAEPSPERAKHMIEVMKTAAAKISKSL